MRVSSLLLGLFTLIVVLTGNSALSEDINSNVEINQSVVFDQDVIFSGSGLFVTANDLTIDCQFNTIRGDGTGTGISFLNNNNVTVKNCLIENFSVALDINNSFIVLNTSLITNNSKGIVIRGSSSLDTNQNSIKKNTINLENTNPVSITSINNWWGSNISGEIASKISGNVNFEPFLNIDPYSDNDGDSVFLLRDNCISDYNPDQTDSDFDGKGDACDINLFLLNSVFDPLSESSNISHKLTTTSETGYYIIQFNQEVTTDLINQLKGLNVEIFDFVPENALIARFDPSIKSQIQNLTFVRFVGVLQPADRLETGLYQAIVNNYIESNETLNLSVSVFTNLSGVNATIMQLGGNFQFSTNDTLSVEVMFGDIINISYIPEVKYITQQPQPFFFNFKTPITVGVRNKSTDQNFYGFDGDLQVIGHLDTGVNTSHPDLVNKIIPDNNYGFLEHPIDWARCNDLLGGGLENQDGSDPIGHGTSTAGVIVGQGTSGTSTSGDIVKGIAPNAKIFSTRVCNKGIITPRLATTLFFGRFEAGDMVKAFTNAYNAGARIHTNSWGSITDQPVLAPNTKCSIFNNIFATYRPYEMTVNEFVYNHEYDLPFFAASNTGRDFPDIFPDIPVFGKESLNLFECSAYDQGEFGYGNLANPATAKNVLTVGGTEQDLNPGCDSTKWYNGTLKTFPAGGVENYTAKLCRQADSDTDLWGGSSRGPTPTNRLKPDVVAPASGRFVLRSPDDNEKVDENFPSTFGSHPPDPRYDFDNKRIGNPAEAKYQVSYGTSYATPTAAGIAALIREFYQKNYSIASPTGALIKATIINGAEDLPDNLSRSDGVSLYSQTGPIPNFREGWGRVNFSKSIRPCGDYLCLSFNEVKSVKQDKYENFSFRFSRDERMEITMDWMDPPGSYLSDRALINDLSLEMISPGGIKYVSSFSNFDMNGESVPVSRKDICRFVYVDKAPTDKDNVGNKTPAEASTKLYLNCNPDQEKITSNVKKLILNHPEDGFWNISVVGKRVESYFEDQNQKFAIVFSGIRGVDAINQIGHLTKQFEYGEKVFIKASGLPPEKAVDIYVLPRSRVSNYDSMVVNLDGLAAESSKNKETTIKTTAKGTLDDIEIWDTSKTNQQTIFSQKSLYNIIIDVDRDGKFDPGIDIVDYHDKPGFTIISCKEEQDICVAIDSSDSTGNKKDIFGAMDSIYTKLYAHSKKGGDYNIFVVKSSSDIDDLDGSELNDLSSDGPNKINLPPNQLVEINPEVWLRGDNPLGNYELILDVDRDGKFNISADAFDLDGFGITREIIAPRFALDSEGNIHVVALLDWELNKTLNYWEKKVVYGKIPADADYKVDVDNPELFNWSEAQTITDFKTIYSTSQGTTRIDPPDIALDKNNEPHIAFGISMDRGEFEWIIYIKLDKNGEKDAWADPTLEQTATNPQCKPQSDGKYLCPGNGQDLLMNYWYTFTDINLHFPKIAIVNGTVPVILSEVDFVLPDMEYMTELFPKYFSFKFVPQFSPYQLGGIEGNPVVQFSGTSLQVAIKNLKQGDLDGSIVWPGNEKYSPEATYKFKLAKSWMENALPEGIVPKLRLDDWVYMPVDEYSKDFPVLTFYNYNLQAENDRIHVVYTRQDYDRQKYELSGSKRLYYQNIDVSGLNLDEGIDDQKRAILYNLNPDDQQNWRIPVPGSEKQILKESDGGYPANGALPELDVDSRGIVHIVWQSGDKIYYATYNPASKSILDYKAIASIKDYSFQAKPSIALDSKNNPHVMWVDRESMEPQNGKIFYVNGNNVEGITDFSDKLEIVNSTVYSPETPFFDYSQVLTNKNSKDDWTDRVYAGWLDFNPYNKQKLIKVKKTMSHVTMLILIDGIDREFLLNNLSKMNYLKGLINENRITIDTSTYSSMPGTTMSSQAELFTGLKPGHSQVLGDNFKDFNFLPENDPDVSSINDFLSSEGVKTIFDYLNELKKSKAAIPSIYTNGIDKVRPDFLSQAKIDFASRASQILNEGDRASYLRDLKNNDNNKENDVADFLTAYILTHDHGISSDPEDINPELIDSKIGEIINALKERNIFNDTIFVITSDHGLVDTIESNSLDNSDLPDLIQESPHITLTDLFLNGRFAYSYSNEPIEEARVYYNNSFNEIYSQSKWWGKIERILVKNADTGKYDDYSFEESNGKDLLAPAGDPFLEDMTFEGSPGIILIAKSDPDPKKNYYFQKPHESIYGDQILLPLIITGKGFEMFSQGDNNFPSEIPMIDVGPTTAFLIGGKKAVNRMEGMIDGKNTYVPELVINGGSPVNFHLYDSKGKHVGPDAFGNIRLEVPGSNYEIDEITGKKHITLLQAKDQYRLEVISFGYGAFGLSINMNKKDESYEVVYPKTFISPSSTGKINLTGTFDIDLDYDGDRKFEKVIEPSKFISEIKDEMNKTATIRLVRVAANDSSNIDAVRSTSTKLEIKTNNYINNGLINIEKISDPSIDSSGFFTLGSFVRINFTDNILHSSEEIKLTINYPDYVLAPNGLSEKSFSIYEKGTQTRINSTVDTDLNRVTAVITRSGEYVVASGDLAPRIENITVIPKTTRLLRADVKVAAKITDNGAVNNATVTLDNATEAMHFNSATGLYEANITGPEISGRYPVIIKAADDNGNIATKLSYFILDINQPEIKIIFPENTSYTTNRINLSYYVDEESNQSYSVDGNAEIQVNNTKPFNLISIPLTLSSGKHSITVFASDGFGNKASKTVDFEIESQNIRISNIVVPDFGKTNKSIPIKATVTNTLIENATNVEIQLLVNGNLSASRLLNISGETSQYVEFSLINKEGRFNITLRSIPLPLERFVDDNIITKEILITDKIPLLLVDDDSNTNDSVYREAILAAGDLDYNFIPYDVSQKGSPGIELLKEFQTVVWFSGGVPTLTPIERENLKAYLNNRGYLLIFSNNLGRDIGYTDFYKSYLFAEWMRESPNRIIEGGFRDPIGNGFLFNILESGDEIRPISPATESFRYSGGESAAIKIDTGLFKTIYFTFGLEDVPDQETRNRIMDRGLSFFSIDTVPPVITNIKPASGSIFPINTTNVTLSLQTDEPSECRLSNASNEFNVMKAFDSTNSLSHTTLITNLTGSRNFTFFMNCKDKFGNQNNTEFVTFHLENRTYLLPVIEPINDLTVFENETVTIVVNATDPDNDPLTLKISDREINGFVPIASRFTHVNKTFTLHTTFNDAGRYDLRISVSDGFDTVSRDFSVTVVNVNRPPLLAPIGNQTLLEGTFFSMKINAQDPDGDDLTFSDNTTLFDINPFNGMITFTPKNSQIGVHYVNISVTDGELTDSSVVLFRVTDTNNPPVIQAIQPQKAIVGELFTLQINASDPDSDPLTFSDDTVIFNISAQGLVNFTPTNTDAGRHIINITVSDGLANDTKIMNLMITGGDQPPIITSITDRITVFINQTFKINVTACHPDLDPECV